MPAEKLFDRETGEDRVKNGVVVPRVLFYMIVAAVPSLIAAGAWYVAVQESNAKHLAVDFANFKTDVYNNREGDERRARAETETVSDINLRLTRIEAQLAFLVNTVKR